MTSRRETDWQIGAVLKNKANSQGTLFSGGTKYMSDKRFPRGYTPERRAEVDQAFPLNSYKGKDNGVYRESLDNIARSTVPVKHLAPRVDDFGNPHPTLIQDGGNPRPGGRRLEKTTYAEYESHPRHVNTGTSPDTLTVRPEHTRDRSVIHELGHHHDHIVGATGLTHGISSMNHLGHIEGFADDYAEQHFRDRKGRPGPVEEYPAMTKGSTPPTFDEGYRNERKMLTLIRSETP